MEKKPQKKWTLKEIDLCQELKRAGMTVKQIAQFMERSYYSVDAYLRRDLMERARRERFRSEQRRYIPHQVTKIPVPAHVIAERESRANEYRTPAQIMLGDPPFSQSALGSQSK